MSHTLAIDPLARAFALTRDVPAPFVAAALGALAGVALFGLVAAVLLRRRPRPALRATANDVVLIPPYPVVAGYPVAAGAVASSSTPLDVAPAVPVGFVPSSALSARAFAKMGYAFGESSAAAPTTASLPALARAAEVETGPMSAVTMESSSSILAGAPIADLDLDDAPTELCEPYFGELAAFTPPSRP